MAERVTVGTLDRILAVLGARVILRVDWNGESLDRLLDADHAAIVDHVVRLLTAAGWLCATEVSFNIYGERGSIDVLAFHSGARALVVVEVKSVVPDIQVTLFTLDRKARLALQIARERGWIARSAGRLLVVRDGRTARRRIAEHAATFGQAFPQRAWAVRRWLAHPDPDQPIAGLWFLPGGPDAVARHRVARRRPAVAHGRADGF